jgi:hypothetical protein
MKSRIDQAKEPVNLRENNQKNTVRGEKRKKMKRTKPTEFLRNNIKNANSHIIGTYKGGERERERESPHLKK